MTDADVRRIAVQMHELLEFGRTHRLDLAVQWIETRFPSAGRRGGSFSQQKVDRILREELGVVPDAD